MGYMDLLKSAVGMSPSNEPQKIDADGKNYTFVPGKNGSLTAAPPDNSATNSADAKRAAAKVVPPAQPVQLAAVRD